MNFDRMARIMGELKDIKNVRNEKDGKPPVRVTQKPHFSHKAIERQTSGKESSLLEFLSTKVQAFNEFEDMSSFVASILRVSSYPFFVVDKHMKIQYMNPACLNFTGLELNNAIGKVDCMRVFNSNLCAKKCAIKQAMSTQKPVIGKRVKVIDKTGQERAIIVSAGPLIGKNGKILGGFEMWRDAMPDEEMMLHNKRLLDTVKNYCSGMTVFFDGIEKRPFPKELENQENWSILIAGMKKRTSDLQNYCNHFMKSSCWDILNCPAERQVQCPAFPNHGSKCWEMDYTWCDGQMQGTAAEKRSQCRKCFVYIRETVLEK